MNLSFSCVKLALQILNFVDLDKFAESCISDQGPDLLSLAFSFPLSHF